MTLRSIALLACLACLALGCKLKERKEPEVIRPYSVPRAESSNGTAEERPAAATLTEAEREIFNDPVYRSYLAENSFPLTELEPRLANKIESEIAQQAIGLLGADQGEQAVALLEANVTSSMSAALDMLLATAYERVERPEDFVLAAQRAVEKFPRFRRAWASLGQAHFRAERWALAIDALGRAVALGETNAFLYGMIGISHNRIGNFVSAEGALRQATVMAPDSSEWKYLLADTLAKQERFEDAAALFGELLRATPDRRELWVAQGECFLRLERWDRAAENFEVAMRLGAPDAAQHLRLGSIYLRKELFDLATDSFLAAVALDPTGESRDLITAARIMEQNGARAEAERLVDGLQASRGASLTEPQRLDLLRLRARIAAGQDLAEDESKILAEVVKLDPTDGRAMIQLGLYHRNKEEYDQASLWFDRAQGIEKYEADAALAHAQMLVSQSRFQAALPYAKAALAKRPSESLQRYHDSIERQSRLASERTKE